MTDEQMFVWQYINQNFDMDSINLLIVDDVTIRVTDVQGEYLDFYWDGKRVQNK